MTPDQRREYQYQLLKLADDDLKKAEHEQELNEILTELNIEL